MNDLLYEKVVKHWDKVTEVPPQTVGPLTPLYKQVTKRLKVMPWPVIILVSAVSVGCLYLLIGSAVTFVVTLLQRGF